MMEVLQQIRNLLVIVVAIMLFRFGSNTYEFYKAHGLSLEQIATAAIGITVMFNGLFLALGLYDSIGGKIKELENKE